MSELKQLLESSMLNEESKTVIAEAFDIAVKAKTAEVESLFEAKLVEAKSEMIKDAAVMIEEAVSNELEQIQEEITHSRTLDVQYAEKLKMFKESYAEKQEESVAIMIAESVADEMAEIKEDIEVAKKHEFVMAMFEQFKGTYERLFGCDDISLVDRLDEATKALNTYKRNEAIDQILESVGGEKREVILTLLESTPTDQLEARFEKLRPILLSERKVETADVVTESVDENVEVTGTVVIEGAKIDDEQSRKIDDRLARSLKLARK